MSYHDSGSQGGRIDPLDVQHRRSDERLAACINSLADQSDVVDVLSCN